MMAGSSGVWGPSAVFCPAIVTPTLAAKSIVSSENLCRVSIPRRQHISTVNHDGVAACALLRPTIQPVLQFPGRALHPGIQSNAITLPHRTDASMTDVRISPDERQ